MVTAVVVAIFIFSQQNAFWLGWFCSHHRRSLFLVTGIIGLGDGLAFSVAVKGDAGLLSLSGETHFDTTGALFVGK